MRNLQEEERSEMKNWPRQPRKERARVCVCDRSGTEAEVGVREKQTGARGGGGEAESVLERLG